MSWTLANLGLIAELAANHLRLSVLPIVASFVIAVPLGYIASRTRVARGLIVGIGSLLYTVPALPLFVILPSILGTQVLDDTNLIVALTIYGVAVMVRSSTDGFAAVDATTLDAAKAIGFSGWSMFWRVSLPLAGPTLLAGMRVVAVSTIALVSVGVIIGSENLGYLFQDGKQRTIIAEVVAGIVASMLLALIVDRLLVLLGRALMPWNRPPRRTTRDRPSRATARPEATA